MSFVSHYSIIHGLLGNGIDGNVSRQLGTGRQQLHEQALMLAYKKVRAKTGRLGVNDFGSGAILRTVNAKTDIDFTLFPDVDGVDGQELVNACKDPGP